MNEIGPLHRRLADFVGDWEGDGEIFPNPWDRPAGDMENGVFGSQRRGLASSRILQKCARAATGSTRTAY